MKNNWTQNFIDKETKSTFATSENFIRKELERKTKDYLAKQDIIPNRINLDVHISEDGSIFIKQFFIVLETKDVLPELADKIEETIGIKPELYFGEENEHETI